MSSITTQASAPARKVLWPHLFMAAYGVGWAITFDVGVRLYGGEIVSILSLVLIPWMSVLRRFPLLKSVLGAYALWVLAIIISDLFNNTAAFDTLRNMSTPIIGGLGLVFVVFCLAREPRSLLTYLFAIAISKAFLGEPLYGGVHSEFGLNWASVQEDTNVFKVRFEPAISPLAIGIAILLGRRGLMLSGLWLIAISVFYLFLDARSAGLAMFGAGLMTIFVQKGFRPNMRQFLIYSIAGLLLSYGAYYGYVQYSLNATSAGHNATQLAYLENPYNPFSLLLVGRSEWAVMPQAIAERPLLGWGSWAIDEDNRFAYIRAESLGATSFYRIDNAASDFHIPAHSVVGAAWVWSGILGFAAMVWLMIAFRRMLAAILGARFSLLPAALYFATLMTWHFFFSPTQIVRIQFPIGLGALIVFATFFSKASLCPKRPENENSKNSAVKTTSPIKSPSH